MSAEPVSYDAATRLAEATRALMDAVVRTEVTDDRLLDAADAIERITGELSASQSERMPWPSAEHWMRGESPPYNPVVGRANPYAPPMQVTTCADGSVRGDVTMQPIHEGPPGAVHGGLVATLLDHLLGHANAAAGHSGMTVELTVRYRRPTPYAVPLVIRARHDRTEGRRIHASGEIVADGEVTAEASGVFVSRRASG